MTTFKHTTLAMAIAALFASPLALAVDFEASGSFHKESTKTSDVTTDGTFHKDATKTFTEDDFIRYDNQAEVFIVKRVNVEKEFKKAGTVRIQGTIDANSAAEALIDDKQVNINNEGVNIALPNTASGTVTNNLGNVGANAAAGNFNQQDNDVAIAATGSADATRAASDAEAFIFQDSEFNTTFNTATTNAATGTVMGNTGNVGLNVAAGDGNQQKNVLVAAVSPGILAEATSYKKQQIDSNFVINEPVEATDSFGNPVFVSTTNTATLTVDGNTGNVGLNVAAGAHNQQINDLQLAVSTGVSVSTGVQ